MSKESYEQFSNNNIPLIDKYMKDFFQAKIKESEYDFITNMYSDIEEFCLRDGKRVRPLLVIAAYNGYKLPLTPSKPIIPMAAIVEMMHSFLLIQDDIIDKSETRRGKKTLHLLSQDKYKKFSHIDTIGRDIAIILADILFANSIEIISSSPFPKRIKNRYLKIFSQTYEMTAWGQILDIIHSMPKNIEPKDNIPMQVGTLKTAYYTIYYPILMGYILTGRNNKKEISRIKEFALPLGIAFQIRDDILGLFGSEKDIGKSSDSDIIEGKFTLIIQETMEILGEGDKLRFINLFTKRTKRSRDIAEIRAIIEKSGAVEKAKIKHGEMIKKSTSLLNELKISSEIKKTILGLTELISKI